MVTALEKVGAGQPFKPGASTWNTFIDAARDYQSRTRDMGRGRDPEDDGLIVVRNDGDSDCPRGGLLWLRSPIPYEGLWRGTEPRYPGALRLAVAKHIIARGVLGRCYGVGDVCDVYLRSGQTIRAGDRLTGVLMSWGAAKNYCGTLLAVADSSGGYVRCRITEERGGYVRVRGASVAGAFAAIFWDAYDFHLTSYGDGDSGAVEIQHREMSEPIVYEIDVPPHICGGHIDGSDKNPGKLVTRYRVPEDVGVRAENAGLLITENLYHARDNILLVELGGATATGTDTDHGGTGTGTLTAPGTTAPGTGDGETETGGTTTPGTTAPGTTTPGTAPGTAPGTTQPGTTAPGTTQPGTTAPGTTQPGTTAPGTEPGTTQPGTEPGTTQPGTEPGTTQPGTGDGGTTAPGTGDDGITQPGTTTPGTTTPGTTTPGTTTPGTTTPAAPEGDYLCVRRYLYSRAENCTGSYDVELMCVDVLRTECHTNADYPQDCDLIDASCIQELVEAYPSAAACAAACTGGGGIIAFADQFNRVEDPII